MKKLLFIILLAVMFSCEKENCKECIYPVYDENGQAAGYTETVIDCFGKCNKRNNGTVKRIRF